MNVVDYENVQLSCLDNYQTVNYQELSVYQFMVVTLLCIACTRNMDPGTDCIDFLWLNFKRFYGLVISHLLK